MQNNSYFCPILIKLEFSEQIFENYSNIKFRENLPSRIRGVSGGQTDRRTDMTRVIAALSNFAHAPKTDPKERGCTRIL
jgi:hypothetical protein